MGRTERSVVGAAAEGQEFESFFSEAEPKLRRALIAAYGFERGREAAAEALAWAWEHWDDLQRKDNPVGYIYRIGKRRTRWRRPPGTYGSEATPEPWYEPRLASALASLTERQRVAVVLVYGFEWQLKEVAELCGLAVTTVQNHLERGLAKLRAAMEVRRRYASTNSLDEAPRSGNVRIAGTRLWPRRLCLLWSL